jgi:GntR family transcriptional regulator of gluconate operon
VVSTISLHSVNLGAQVAQRLREMILRRDLPDGMRLVEEELAGRFDVSRGPIRDALKQLEREGLVAVRKRAAYVVALTAEDIGHLYDLRKALELLAVESVTRNATDEQFAQMQSCVERMREAAVVDDHAAFADADVDFHGLLFSTSGNRRLADVWYQYMPILATILQSAVGQEERLHKSAEDHHSLLGMLRARDEAVAAEVGDHIDRARERMIAAYERLAVEAAG